MQGLVQVEGGSPALGRNLPCECVQVILRIAGTGVTPFGPANQERLIQVLAYGTGNVSNSAFGIVLIADAYSSRRRALLSWPWEGLVVSCPASLGSCVHAGHGRAWLYPALPVSHHMYTLVMEGLGGILPRQPWIMCTCWTAGGLCMSCYMGVVDCLSSDWRTIYWQWKLVLCMTQPIAKHALWACAGA